MNHISLILAIVIPISVASFMLAAWMGLSLYLTSTQISSKGMELFKFDTYSRKIYPINYSKNRYVVKSIKQNTWTSIKSLMSQFINDPSIESKFRSVISSLSQTNERTIFEFDSTVSLAHKKHLYHFVFSFYPKEDDSDYILSVTWKQIEDKNKKTNEEPILISNEEILASPAKYKSFVAFNINKEIEGASERLQKLLTDSIGEGLQFTTYNDLLIVVFFNNKNYKIKKEVERFISKTKSKAFKNGAKTFFNGSGYSRKEDVTTSKDLMRIYKALNFFIMLSINLNKNFITSDADKKDYNADDLQKFTKASSVFRTAVRSRDLETQYIPVKNIKTGRKVIDYSFPEVSGLNNRMLSSLLINRNNKAELTNSHAKKVSIENSIDRPVLLDINSDWLIENHKKMSFKKAIYVINVKRDTSYDTLKEVVKYMSDNGFYFAIRLVKLTEVMATLIKQTSPQFILIDRSVWGENGLADPSTYIWLLTVKRIAEAEKIKVIYENPSKFLDDATAEKIGMNFYYNF